MSQVRKVYSELCQLLRKVSTGAQVSAVLSYDQQVFMPSDAAETRANQLELVAGIVHDLATAPAIKDCLAELEKAELSSELTAYEQAVVREARRNFKKRTAIPKHIAEEKARLDSQGYMAWVAAKGASDFSAFAPHLERNIDMTKKLCQYLDPELAKVSMYDVCLDEYERGLTSTRLNAILAEIRSAIVPLIKRVAQSGKTVDASCLSGKFDVSKMRAANEEIVRRMGFNFSKGRLDVSPHPFSMSAGANDVRITTRYSDNEWLQAVAGTVHEFGHSMYESGLRPSGLPVDEALSMGMHESQSLIWERMVGLHPSFWRFAIPILRDIGGIYTLNDAPFETVMLAINSVSPHFIRIESDELTYVMHIVMRYEFELEMLAGRMTVSELPARWNAKIKEYLGLDVPSDKLGCLQDVHWSSPGVFGYFPTYLLGAMNAAQLWHALTRELGAETVYSQIEQGEFGAIRQWLAEHVHIHGSFYPTADELLKVATGETMNPKYFIQYLTEKYSRLYDLQ